MAPRATIVHELVKDILYDLEELVKPIVDALELTVVAILFPDKSGNARLTLQGDDMNLLEALTAHFGFSQDEASAIIEADDLEE